MTTEKQLAVLQWIRNFIRVYSWPPSIRDVCDGFSWGSTSTAYYHLNALERDGLIVRGSQPRQIRLTAKGKEETI